MRSVVQIGANGQGGRKVHAMAAEAERLAIDARAELTQALIPIGQEAVNPGAPGDKLDCWKNADQKHRWLATALLDIEPRLHKVCGQRQLARLRTALQTHLKGSLEQVA